VPVNIACRLAGKARVLIKHLPNSIITGYYAGMGKENSW